VTLNVYRPQLLQLPLQAEHSDALQHSPVFCVPMPRLSATTWCVCALTQAQPCPCPCAQPGLAHVRGPISALSMSMASQRPPVARCLGIVELPAACCLWPVAALPCLWPVEALPCFGAAAPCFLGEEAWHVPTWVQPLPVSHASGETVAVVPHKHRHWAGGVGGGGHFGHAQDLGVRLS